MCTQWYQVGACGNIHCNIWMRNIKILSPVSSGFYFHYDISIAFPTSASLNHIHKDLGSHSLTSNKWATLHPPSPLLWPNLWKEGKLRWLQRLKKQCKCDGMGTVNNICWPINSPTHQSGIAKCSVLPHWL